MIVLKIVFIQLYKQMRFYSAARMTAFTFRSKVCIKPSFVHLQRLAWGPRQQCQVDSSLLGSAGVRCTVSDGCRSDSGHVNLTQIQLQ